ncbi:MAG: hypothetical protein FD156_2464 [Nitrospirae bacterium]|nr:MAG: hypothetical protein FD156_2464 [Nitrospirota bacterium]
MIAYSSGLRVSEVVKMKISSLCADVNKLGERAQQFGSKEATDD